MTLRDLYQESRLERLSRIVLTDPDDTIENKEDTRNMDSGKIGSFGFDPHDPFPKEDVVSATQHEEEERKRKEEEEKKKQGGGQPGGGQHQPGQTPGSGQPGGGQKPGGGGSQY